ncbi:MAG: hypothetical protein JW929_14265, partial [Anaerolineales bacterium]|nr:hypothetical protein [Anaerolineales bacterium]
RGEIVIPARSKPGVGRDRHPGVIQAGIQGFLIHPLFTLVSVIMMVYYFSNLGEKSPWVDEPSIFPT